MKLIKLSLERQAMDAIREAIVTGEHDPGSRLVETQLAEHFQVSRGTIRAALGRLANEGLVEQVAYTKWMVPPLRSRHAWELYTLRSALEGLAATLVARSVDADKTAKIERAFGMIAMAAREKLRREATDADFLLHQTIVDCAGHALLATQYRIIADQVRRYMSTSNALVASEDELVSQHRPIVEAILAGDERRAADVSAEHNLKEGDALVRHLRAIEHESMAADHGRAGS